MKQYLLMSGLLVILSYSASAQTEKEDWMVGGNFTINTAENNTRVELRPSAGYFILRNFAVGGNFLFSFSRIGEKKETAFGIGPFARLYFTSNVFRPFLHGDFSFNTSTTRTPNGPKYNAHGTSFLLGVGGAYFINDNVALEATTGYSNTKTNGTEASGGFALRVGFQVYLNKNQVASLRRQ